MRLGPVGLWSWELRATRQPQLGEAVSELDELGYAAVWIPSGDDKQLDVVEDMLAATSRMVVATGIMSIWVNDPAKVAARHVQLNATHGGRFLLGLGVSHPHLVESLPGRRWEHPLAEMVSFLDRLDSASPPVPASERVLAALGPNMLRLASQRSAGAHPYLVSPEHTRLSRELLGESALLAPEQKVILDTDPGRARSLARERLGMYLAAPNYRRNLVSLGFSEDDFSNGGSDSLIDSLVAWGDLDAIAARVREHRDAGADHVCVQVLHEASGLPQAQWRELAGALLG